MELPIMLLTSRLPLPLWQFLQLLPSPLPTRPPHGRIKGFTKEACTNVWWMIASINKMAQLPFAGLTTDGI
jgi:hypothetical protein